MVMPEKVIMINFFFKIVILVEILKILLMDLIQIQFK